MTISFYSRDILFSLGILSVCTPLNGVVGQFSGESVMDMLPDNVKEVIPDRCQSGPDAELQRAIDCAFGNMLQCAGLYGVMDQFENLIPSQASNCNDVQEPFCAIASKCRPCTDEFEALVGCVASYSEPGAIDADILKLVNGCPLTCDGSSGSVGDVAGNEVPEPLPNPSPSLKPVNPSPKPIPSSSPSLRPVNSSPKPIPNPSPSLRPVNPSPSPKPKPDPTPIADEENDENSPTELKDITTTAIENGSFTTLVTALDAADLANTLSRQGPFTVFAPTDDAFASLPNDLVPCLLLPENKDTLSSVLTYHVASGKVASTNLKNNQTIPTIQGENVKIGKTSAGVKVNQAKVIIPDVMATNGIIHVIDSVLVPPTINIRAFLATCPPSTPIGGNEFEDLINGDGLGDLVGGEGAGDSAGGSVVGGDGLGDLVGGDGGFGGIDIGGDNGLGDLISGEGFGDLESVDPDELGDSLGEVASGIFGPEIGDAVSDAWDSIVGALFGGGPEGGIGGDWFSF